MEKSKFSNLFLRLGKREKNRDKNTVKMWEKKNTIGLMNEIFL